MRLAKWTALGNHFLLAERELLPFALSEARARILCDPAVGLGADGVLELWTPEDADVAVRVWNLDGSVAEVSGNGTRIAAAFAATALGRTRAASWRPTPARVVPACSPTAASP